MRRLIAPLLAAAAVLLPLQRAAACSCVADSVAGLVGRAQVAFSGTADGVVRQPGSGAAVLFLVDRVYKGDVPRRARVRGGDGLTSCDIEFSSGRQYTVLARIAGDAFQTRLCDGSSDDPRLLEDAGIRPVKTYERAAPMESPGAPAALAGSDPTASRFAPILLAWLLTAGAAFAWLRLRPHSPGA